MVNLRVSLSPRWPSPVDYSTKWTKSTLHRSMFLCSLSLTRVPRRVYVDVCHLPLCEEAGTPPPPGVGQGWAHTALQPCSPACSLLLAESSSRPQASLSTWGLPKPLRMVGLLLLLRLGIPLVNSPGGELRKETETILPKHDALIEAVTARTGLSHNLGLPYLHSYRVIHTVCQC